jgi:hypothetical protein
MIRHGNASEGIVPTGDGSLWDPGYIDSTPTFQPPFDDLDGQPYTRFLTQDILEIHWQAGCTAGFSLGFKKIGANLLFSARYLFDYVQNEGFLPGETYYHYFSLTTEFRL